jgi:magnesium transporter
LRRTTAPRGEADMIDAWKANASGAERCPTAAVREMLAAEGTNVWIDLDGEGEETARTVLEPLGVHPLVIDDMVAEVNRPKVDDYGDYLYLVVHSARWEAGAARPAMREIDIVLSRRMLVTYHDGTTRSITEAGSILPRRPELLARSPAHLLHFLLDVLVDHYLPIMDRLADDVDALEEEVFTDDARDKYERIIALKRGIAALRRIIGPQRDTILALTRDEFRAIPAEVRPYLRDVYDRLARISDLLDSFRDEIAGLLELHVSVVSNRMNRVMKRLTVVATIFMPLTVVTGYFGMNFHLSEYEWGNGQAFALGVMAVTAIVTWIYLRARHLD